MRRTIAGSNSRSSRVRGVDTASSVREKTTLSAARHTSAKSSSSGAGAACAGDVSAGSPPTVCQTAIVSYMRRP
jgi:hypothetical protein